MTPAPQPDRCTHSQWGRTAPRGFLYFALYECFYFLFYYFEVWRPGAGVLVFSFRFGGWTFGEPWSVRIVGFSCAPGGWIGERFFYYAITEELHASVIYLEK